ncbi:hypothetical protein DW930_05140 [Streptococcus sp. AM43-2AT]|nr:hypothetical protein DW930_05140 [Streptococcus sp. AM43-2AT]
MVGNNTIFFKKKMKRDHSITTSIVDLFPDANRSLLLTTNSYLALSFLGSGKGEGQKAIIN